MNRIRPLAVASVMALSASPVLAHARLVSTTPAAGANVTAPRSVHLTFSERFAAPFSTVEVEDSRGRAVSVTKIVSEDGKTLGGTFAAPLLHEALQSVEASERCLPVCLACLPSDGPPEQDISIPVGGPLQWGHSSGTAPRWTAPGGSVRSSHASLSGPRLELS